MVKHRVALLLVGLSAASFVLGAVWVHKQLFPYQEIRDMDWMVMLKRNVVGSLKPTSFVESAFSDFEIEHFELGREVPMRIERGGIDAIGNDVLVVSSRGDLFYYRNDSGRKTIDQLDIETNNNFDQARSRAEKIKVGDVPKYFNYFDVLYF